MELKNKIILITDPSTGIGKAPSLTLNERGCKIALTYHHTQKDVENPKSNGDINVEDNL